jgi:crossover junction endodeoxyribonuclease RusA
MTITLTLPYPIRANQYWRSRAVKGVSMTYVSPEARAYKQQVAWLAKAAGVRQPISGRVCVSYVLYPKRPQDWAKRAEKDPLGWDDTVACLDLDNAQKVLFDALKGVAIIDDKWVRRIVAERMEPDGEARVVVTITPLAASSPQASLL